LSAPRKLAWVARAAVAAALAVGIAGCSYDYEQHTDRVAYSAGDAVRANLEAETINPYKRSIYRTKGLGANGNVIPATTAAPSTTTASSSTPTASTGN
jgi:hypothetical protein